MIWAWLACASPSAEPSPRAADADMISGVAIRGSWWCLELHGKKVVFWERPPDQPKVEIRGTLLSTVVQAGETRVTLRVDRIHQARFISRCRKRVYGDEDLQTYTVDSQVLKPGDVFEVTLRDGKLCVGETCHAARREPLFTVTEAFDVPPPPGKRTLRVQGPVPQVELGATVQILEGQTVVASGDVVLDESDALTFYVNESVVSHILAARALGLRAP